MSNLLRDFAALGALVSFIVVIGFWAHTAPAVL
jgi:hypothetical protein